MNIWYRVISFGHNEHGFWNRPQVFSNYTEATKSFSEVKEDSETEGAFFLIQKHEDWMMIDEFETNGYFLNCGPFMSFQAKQL